MMTNDSQKAFSDKTSRRAFSPIQVDLIERLTRECENLADEDAHVKLALLRKGGRLVT